jgi:transposase InsO family protein
MRGVPDHSKEQPSDSPSITVTVLPPTLIPKSSIPDRLAELGREVLDMVPRKQRGSLEAYRQAAHDLSAILKVNGVRMKPKNLYYVALRVKWIADNTSA